jgi:Adaptin N terminal region
VRAGLQVVAASALVAGLHMYGANAEVVKRWTSEIVQAVQSKNAMVQYHAIALQTAIKSSDRLAISKILSTLTIGAVRSPMAQCLIVRAPACCAWQHQLPLHGLLSGLCALPECALDLQVVVAACGLSRIATMPLPSKCACCAVSWHSGLNLRVYNHTLHAALRLRWHAGSTTCHPQGAIGLRAVAKLGQDGVATSSHALCT